MMWPSSLTTRQSTEYCPGESVGSAAVTCADAVAGEAVSFWSASPFLCSVSAVTFAASENFSTTLAGAVFTTLLSAGVASFRWVWACATEASASSAAAIRSGDVFT